MYNALRRAAGRTVQHKPQIYIQKQIQYVLNVKSVIYFPLATTAK